LIFITILIGVYSCGSQQKQDGVGKLNTGQVENSLEVKDTILDVEELDKEVRNNCNCKNGMLEEYPVAIDSDDMFLIDSLVDGNKVIQAYFFQLKDSVLPKKITNQISQRTGWHCLPDLESPFGNEIIRTDSSLSILLKDTIQYHFN